MTPPDTLYRFAQFELDLAERQLRAGGEPVELGNRYFDALALLVQHAGSLVSKDAFMDQVWRGIPVTDEALTQCIRTLRRALGDDAASPRFIQTVPKHGYRFVAQVEDVGDEGQAPTPAPIERASLASRIAAGCTIAGALAGALGGGIYGAIAGSGGGSALLVLAALIAALGLLAGAGIGLGLAGMLAWRGKPDALLVAGAAAGGMAVGALGNTLGRDGIALITGAQGLRATGMTEGLLLGAAAGGAAWMLLIWKHRRALAAAPLFGGMAGLAIHLGGGTLLGGTLASLQHGLERTGLSLQTVGALLGESAFGPLSHALTATAEGALFVTAIALGVALAKRTYE